MGPNVDIEPHIRAAALFAKCSPGAIEFIADRARIEHHDDAEVIVAAGDEGDEFYIVVDGIAEVRVGGSAVRELGAGEYFGELALLDPAPRSADVVAKGPVTVASVDGATFDLLLQVIPTVARQLLAGIAAAWRADSMQRAEAETWRI